MKSTKQIQNPNEVLTKLGTISRRPNSFQTQIVKFRQTDTCIVDMCTFGWSERGGGGGAGLREPGRQQTGQTRQLKPSAFSVSLPSRPPYFILYAIFKWKKPKKKKKSPKDWIIDGKASLNFMFRRHAALLYFLEHRLRPGLQVWWGHLFLRTELWWVLSHWIILVPGRK